MHLKLTLCLSLIASLLSFAAVGANPANAAELPVQTLMPAGATYSRAQVLDWIDDTQFAVGRWDGTVSVFRLPGAAEYGPVIEQAWAGGSGRGIEMLTAVSDRVLIVSDGPDKLAVWKKSADRRFTQARTVKYDAAVCTANSGAAVEAGGSHWFVSGHENGFVLIWKRRNETDFTLAHTVDLRSASPIPAPFPLKNIRDLVIWRNHYLIAASEDGDLVAIDIPTGTETFRHRYNAAAQRGINDIAVLDDWLLVANCSVGAADRNLWLFNLSSGTPELSDAANLVLDAQRSQVFNFEVELIKRAAAVEFFSSTEEGLLWHGKVTEGQLTVSGVTKVASEGGAVLDQAPRAGMLAAVAHQVLLFKTDQ